MGERLYHYIEPLFGTVVQRCARKHPACQVMGYSMRTPLWRYTEWAAFGCSPMRPMECEAAVAPRWDSVVGTECAALPSHRGGPCPRGHSSSEV